MDIVRISKLSALLCALATVLITSSAFAATAGKTRQLTPGEKAKMSGLILSRDGDLVRVRDKKSHEVITVSIGDATQIERKTHKLPFYRHTDMTPDRPSIRAAIASSDLASRSSNSRCCTAMASGNSKPGSCARYFHSAICMMKRTRI